MKKTTVWMLFVLIIIGAWNKGFCQNANADEAIYRQAVHNAMYPEASKIDSGLVPITRQNQNLVWKQFDGEDYILVVTWKQNVSYYKPYIDSAFYNTGSYQIWITTAPELLSRMKKENCQDVNQRLKQLLGLPPTASYSYFVEFWVKPPDLFRPCPDNEISDKQCDICFPKNADAEYISWVNNSRISRYYQCDWFNQYPWTQLGYTYDWAPENKSHFGLSEFVIDVNKNIKVKAIYTTEEYMGQ